MSDAFNTSLIAPGGDDVVFQIIGGALSGSEGSGSTDRYRASRGPDGWVTQGVSPGASQTSAPSLGSFDSEHGYYFLIAGQGVGANGGADYGTLVEEFGVNSVFLRDPDGNIEPLAVGSLGSDLTAEGFYISPGGGHVIFSPFTGAGDVDAVQLEPDAPPSGTPAIYDRTPGGETHVISLLPGNLTPTAGEGAFYQGSSAAGNAVAFKLGTAAPKLFVRVNNEQTYQVTAGPNTFAGISADGGEVFYSNTASVTSNDLSQSEPQVPGDLFSFDTATQATTQITNVGDARFVNVSSDGSHVYFESEKEIGGQGASGQPNLYVWDRASGETLFIATVSPGDLTGENYASFPFPPNLVGWTEFATSTHPAGQFGAGANLSRTSPDGDAIVFESSAQLTAFDNAGHSEIYRYRVGDAGPTCISCGPGLGPATTNASLQSVTRQEPAATEPVESIFPTANLSENGNVAIFQSSEALLPADTNGRQDVYEWEAEGEGSCQEATSCLALISTGQASRNSYLYAASADASNIVLLTPQELLPQDENGATGALYDARVNGGFPLQETSKSEGCLGDSCQGEPAPAPSLPAPSSATLHAGKQAKHRHHKRKKHHGRHRRGHGNHHRRNGK